MRSSFESNTPWACLRANVARPWFPTCPPVNHSLYTQLSKMLLYFWFSRWVLPSCMWRVEMSRPWQWDSNGMERSIMERSIMEQSEWLITSVLFCRIPIGCCLASWIPDSSTRPVWVSGVRFLFACLLFDFYMRPFSYSVTSHNSAKCFGSNRFLSRSQFWLVVFFFFLLFNGQIAFI